MLMAIPHVPETPEGKPFDENPKVCWTKGQGSAGPVAGFVTLPGAPDRPRGEAANTAAALRRTEFIAKSQPTARLIVGGLEEIRTDDAANEIYVADNAFGGRVMVFSLDTFQFKRGWGAYGHKVSEISTKPEDHAYTPNGPMAKEFVGHLTFNFSNDGLLYAADRAGNRIHVTDKQVNFKKEIRMPEWPGIGGAAGGVMFSPDKAQQFLSISDLTNNHVWFLDRAEAKIVAQLGRMG